MSQNPLDVLTSIEQQHSLEQEMELQLLDGGNPYIELLAKYLEILNEFSAKENDMGVSLDIRGFEDGHAGGCG
ncbi:DUF6269 family protein [Streptomyces sp. NPDC050504]|uniref:DUF6269 family protein n=1 Tax=Streptomyces sp. NPDC050504 TaxID=3365618 RepID=UPI00378E2327